MQSDHDFIGQALTSRRSPKMRQLFSSLSQESNSWKVAAYLLLATFLILILLTFRDYGITYDEFWRNDYGNAILQWFASGFQNTHALTTFDYQYYGSFFTVVQNLISRISPLGVFETNHLVNALFSLITVFLTFKLAKLLGNPFIGFLSVLFLLINPRYYGHSFNNPIDLPLAAFYILSLYLIVKVIYSLPKLSRSAILILGMTIGLALGIRLSSLIIFFYMVLALGLWLFSQKFLMPEGELRQIGVSRMVLDFTKWLFLIGILAYLVMLVFWPAAQVSPIRQPVRAFRYFLDLNNPFTVLFNGKEILNTDLPWHYQIDWFLITMPEFLIVSLGIGIVLGFITNRNLEGIRRSLAGARNQGIILLLISIVVPLAYTALRKPTAYDGIRHFLFLVPPLAILAAISIGKLFQISKLTWLNYGLLALVFFSMLISIADMFRLHPDEYIYFNRLLGKGVAQASSKYDTDYWGNSYKEAVEWVEMNYVVPAGSPKVKVASCLYSLSTSYYLKDDRFEYIGSYHDGQRVSGVPDLFLASPRWNCDQKHDGQVVHLISKMGAPLVYIMQVSH